MTRPHYGRTDSAESEVEPRESNRVPTGIEQLDRLMEGGFPAGSLILVVGGVGSGKTIFSAQYLYHGASKFNEPGIYISFAENRDVFFKNMKRIGMNFEELEEKGLAKFMDLITVKGKGIEEIFGIIFAELQSLKAKRLVIDPFSAISQAFSEKIEARILLHTILGKITRFGGVTTLLISEKPYCFKAEAGVEEFVTDGVVALDSFPEGEYLKRMVQILKMRGTRINSAQHSFDIDDHGIQVYPVPETTLVQNVSSERLSTGIKGLDEMLGGGVFKGSVTLAAGSAGTGKTTTALHFVAEAAKQNEKSLYISLEESVEGLIQTGEGFSWDFRKFVDRGLTMIVAYSPEPFNAERHFFQISDLLKIHKPTRFVVDSLFPLERSMPKVRYLSYLNGLISYLKANAVTSFFTYGGELGDPGVAMGVSTLIDNLVSLRYVELESALKRSLVIFKASRTRKDEAVREFEITPKGIVVKGKFLGVEQVLGGFARKSLTDEAVRAWAEAFGGKR